MKTKYQIFISFTLEDLKEYPDKVIMAVLEMGHIPVGMEMFSAGDDEQWQLIQRTIDDCDYYVVIVAHRYGSVDASGVSYTEKEYDYARSKSIPTLGFVIAENASWPPALIESDAIAKAALVKFVSKVKGRMVNFWSSPTELHSKVCVALMKEFNARPRPGWVRANEAPGPAAMSELSRLSQENAELRKRIEQAAARAVAADEESSDADTLEGNAVVLDVFDREQNGWVPGPPIDMLMLFSLVGSNLMLPQPFGELRQKISDGISGMWKWLSKSGKPAGKGRHVGVRDVLLDYFALGRVEAYQDRVPNDMGGYEDAEFWKLTPKGHSFYSWGRVATLRTRAAAAKK